MPDIYTTRQGETVDLACSRHYGRTKDVTEAVLAANTGLAALGPILPMGTQIIMPPPPPRSERPLVKLYE